jgi:hypothetical protein
MMNVTIANLEGVYFSKASTITEPTPGVTETISTWDAQAVDSEGNRFNITLRFNGDVNMVEVESPIKAAIDHSVEIKLDKKQKILNGE